MQVDRALNHPHGGRIFLIFLDFSPKTAFFWRLEMLVALYFQ
jgi:hypothetical protein